MPETSQNHIKYMELFNTSELCHNKEYKSHSQQLLPVLHIKYIRTNWKHFWIPQKIHTTWKFLDHASRSLSTRAIFVSCHLHSSCFGNKMWKYNLPNEVQHSNRNITAWNDFNLFSPWAKCQNLSFCYQGVANATNDFL